jgi:hypothetical protein
MNHPAHSIRLLRKIASLICGISLVSCGSTQPKPPPVLAVPKSAPGSHWVKVSSRPPTFYPRGVPASAPTDHRNGEWVYTGDDQGTRFFIPHHPRATTSREILLEEALAARSQRKLDQIAAEDSAILSRDIKNTILMAPPMTVLLFFGAMMGGGLPVMDLHHLQKSWKESKQPKQSGWAVK